MAATAIVQAKVEEALKARAEKIFAERGQTISEAVNAFLIQTVEDEEYPYKPLRPNAETVAAMEDLRNGVNVKRFRSVADLMADLDAND